MITKRRYEDLLDLYVEMFMGDEIKPSREIHPGAKIWLLLSVGYKLDDRLTSNLYRNMITYAQHYLQRSRDFEHSEFISDDILKGMDFRGISISPYDTLYGRCVAMILCIARVLVYSDLEGYSKSDVDKIKELLSFVFREVYGYVSKLNRDVSDCMEHVDVTDVSNKRAESDDPYEEVFERLKAMSEITTLCINDWTIRRELTSPARVSTRRYVAKYNIVELIETMTKDHIRNEVHILSNSEDMYVRSIREKLTSNWREE